MVWGPGSKASHYDVHWQHATKLYEKLNVNFHSMKMYGKLYAELYPTEAQGNIM
jgi:hypothetical protein